MFSFLLPTVSNSSARHAFHDVLLAPSGSDSDNNPEQQALVNDERDGSGESTEEKRRKLWLNHRPATPSFRVPAPSFPA